MVRLFANITRWTFGCIASREAGGPLETDRVMAQPSSTLHQTSIVCPIIVFIELIFHPSKNDLVSKSNIFASDYH